MMNAYDDKDPRDASPMSQTFAHWNAVLSAVADTTIEIPLTLVVAWSERDLAKHLIVIYLL